MAVSPPNLPDPPGMQARYAPTPPKPRPPTINKAPAHVGKAPKTPDAGVGAGVTVGDGEGVVVGEDEGVNVRADVGVIEVVGVPVSVVARLAVAVGVIDAEPEGDGDADSEDVGVNVGVNVDDGVRVGDDETELETEGDLETVLEIEKGKMYSTSAPLFPPLQAPPLPAPPFKLGEPFLGFGNPSATDAVPHTTTPPAPAPEQYVESLLIVNESPP